MAGSKYNYEVVITTTVHDQTRGGARSSQNNVENMAKRSADAVVKSSKTAMTALDRMEKKVAEENRQYFAALEKRKQLEIAGARAAESLQKQRSSALMALWKKEEREFERSEKQKTKAAEKAVHDAQRAREKSANESYKLYQREVREFEKAEKQKTRIAEREERERQKEFNRNVDRVRRAGSGTRQIGNSMQQGGVVTTAALTIPFVLATKQAIDFESAFAGVVKTVDASQEELAVLRKEFRGLSTEIPITSIEISRIGEAAGQLGVKNKDILMFTKTMAALGVTTNMTSDQASDSLARFANIMNNELGPQFDRIGSTVVALGNKSAATESEIVAMSLRIAGAGKQIKLTEAQILGLAASLSSVGLEAEAGGSAISRVMMRIAVATEKGGADLENFAKISQMSAAEFKQAFEKDAASAILKFIEGLGKMAKEGDSVFSALEELGFDDIRVRDALLRASGAGELFAATLAVGNKAWEENNALTKEAAQRYATTASRLAILKNMVVDMAVTLGEGFLNAISPVLPFLTGIVSKISEFVKANPAIAQMASVVGAALASLGPLLLILGTIVVAVGAVVSGIATLVGAITAAAAAIGGFGALLALVSVTAVQIGVVLGALAAIVVTVYTAWANNFGGLRDLTTEVMNAIVSAVQAGLSFLQEMWAKYGGQIKEIVGTVFNGAYAVVKTVVSALVTFARENLGILIGWVKTNWPLIKETIETGLVRVLAVVKFTLAAMVAFWTRYGDEITGVVQATWVIVKTVIQTALQLVLGVVRIAMQLMNGDTQGALATFVGLFSLAFDAVKKIFFGLVVLVVNAIKGLGKAILDLAQSLQDAGMQLGAAIITGVVNGIKSGYAAVKTAASGMSIGIIQAAKIALGSRSPSRVFFDIGRNVALGFILGISSMQAQVQDELQRMVIPPKPEQSTGKGKKIADTKDRIGFDLLEQLYADTDQLAPAGEKTKALAIDAELAKTKYNQLSDSVRIALKEAASYYDQQKAYVDVQNMVNEQLDKAAEKLLDLKYPTKEGATELEKFDLMINRMRDSSPKAAIALTKFADVIERVRNQWKTADIEEASRKARESAEALGKSVATMADEATAALKGMDDKTDTSLEKMLLQFTRLKDVSITLQQLNPIKDLTKSIQELPEPARINAIAAALNKIFMFGGGRPAGFTDDTWKVFLDNTAKAIDASSQKDNTTERDKAASEYNKILEDLNGKLVENTNETNRARIERELETEAYKHLNEAQKDSLRQRASEVDAMVKQREAQQQLREALEGYIDDIEQVLTNALGSLLDGDFKGFWDSIKQGFNQLWKSIILDLVSSGIRSALRSVFENIFGGVMGGSGGGGSGGGIGGILGGVLGGVFGGSGRASGTGTGQGTPQAGAGAFTSGMGSISSLISGSMGDEFHAPSGRTSGSTATSVATSAGSTAARSAASTGFSLAGIGSSLGAMAPLLGLTLGMQVGGGGGLSGAMGGAGGLLLGSAALFGSLAFGGIGVALLVGAYFLNRNKQRRKEEQQRAQILGDSKSKLTAILNGVNADQIDGADAMSQAASVRSEYIAAVSQLKDSKTRRIALETVRELDAIISQIQVAVTKQDKRKEFENKFSPTFKDGGSVRKRFASGGLVPGSPEWLHYKFVGQWEQKRKEAEGGSSRYFSGLVPGVYDRADDRTIRVSGNEVVLTPDVWQPITPYLASRRVPGITPSMMRPGFADGGGAWLSSPSSANSPAGQGQIVISVGRIRVDAAGIVFEGLRSSDNREVVIETVDRNIRVEREGGLLGTINEVQTQG